MTDCTDILKQKKKKEEIFNNKKVSVKVHHIGFGFFQNRFYFIVHSST